MRKFVVGIAAVVCAVSLSAFGQNKVVFDNQSGDPALVRLIGPTKTEVQVPNGAKEGVDAAAGKYTIKVRYGTAGNYRYSKGQEFEVTETATARSETTITLHKVVAGNYDAHPISESEFGTIEPGKTLPKASAIPSTKTAAIQTVYELLGNWRSAEGSLAAGNSVSASDISDVQEGRRLATDLMDKGASLPEVAKQVAAKYPRLILTITPEKQPEYTKVEHLLAPSTNTWKGVPPVDTWHSFGWFVVGVAEGKVVTFGIDCRKYNQPSK
jgi:hypothetical protein